MSKFNGYTIATEVSESLFNGKRWIASLTLQSGEEGREALREMWSERDEWTPSKSGKSVGDARYANRSRLASINVSVNAKPSDFEAIATMVESRFTTDYHVADDVAEVTSPGASTEAKKANPFAKPATEAPATEAPATEAPATEELSVRDRYRAYATADGKKAAKDAGYALNTSEGMEYALTHSTENATSEATGEAAAEATSEASAIDAKLEQMLETKLEQMLAARLNNPA